MNESTTQTGMATHAAIAACVAAFIGGIWVLVYTMNTTSGQFMGTPLLEFVTGSSVGSSVFQSTEALFVVVTRFLLAFGLLWAPLALVSKIIAAMSGK